MESARTKGLMLQLGLGKFRVIEKQNNTIKVALGGSTTMTFLLPDGADVRAGDILTFYTDVPYANPSGTPIQ